jgi:hypothetical protein
MFARVVTAQVSPARLDEAIKVWKESVMPAVKSQKGFSSGRLMVNRSTGKIVTVALWNAESDMRATAGGFVQEQIAKFGSMFSGQPIVEEYEVAVEA